MRQWIRSHLTYANVVATLSLFLVLGGGTALGAYVVSSNSQVGPGTISGHKPATVNQHPNIIPGSITGQDIADQSNVDTCKSVLWKLGPICAGSDGKARTLEAAITYCARFGDRLPSFPEAVAMGMNHDVPGVSGSQKFWTDEEVFIAGEFDAEIANEDGTSFAVIPEQAHEQTVCVTDPSA